MNNNQNVNMVGYNNQGYNYGYNNVNNSVIPPEYKPISAWGYFGYNILFSIPLVGFIMLLVYSFGGTSNINLKNYARSFFCGYLIGLIFLIIIFIPLIIYSANL